MNILKLCLTLLILPFSHAQSNVTDTKAIVGWQAEPKTRGTWSLLWSCTATLVLCVYTTNHMPICDKKGIFRKTLSKSFWLLLGLFTPELTALRAWQEWRYAKHLTKKVAELRKEREAVRQSVPQCMQEWSMMHSFFVVMGALAMYRYDGETQERSYITPDGLVVLIREGQDKTLAVLTESAISDRSKADFLAKSLTLLQVSHTLVLVLVRVVTRRSISILEIITCGYIAFSAVQMFFWWSKPYNVQDPVILDIQNSSLNRVDIGHYSSRRYTKPASNKLVWTRDRTPRGPNFEGDIGCSTIDDRFPVWSTGLMTATSTIVGGLHLAFWNAIFPTTVEKWLWRVSSIIITSASLVVFLVFLLALTAADNDEAKSAPQPSTPINLSPTQPQPISLPTRRRKRAVFLLIFEVALDYLLTGQDGGYSPRAWNWCRDRFYWYLFLAARTYVFVAGFTGLRSLPADVYSVPPWTSIIPNFG